MPTYTYKARNATGKLIRGTMEAASRDEVMEKLSRMGCMATEVHQTQLSPGTREPFFEKFMPIGVEAMIMFYIQFANMISAGIPILTILDTLSAQLENKRLKDAVGGVARSVEGGETLSQAFSKFPRIFTKLFVSMVKAGEASGKLDKVLVRYAEYYEYQEDLRQKIKGALFYPTILLFAGVAVTLFIVTFVIPQFASIFVKAGITLPVPTLILNSIGMGLKRFWHIGILFCAFIFLGLRRYARTEKGRVRFDRMKLDAPVVGSLLRKTILSRFSKTLATLVSSGVEIIESLDITRDVVGNEVMGRVIQDTRQAVERGEKISEPLRLSGEFPADTVQMIAVGEETGDLDGMLNKIAGFYDMTISYAIRKLTTALEPIFLVIMGALVGFIMMSVLLPIFDMIKILRH